MITLMTCTNRVKDVTKSPYAVKSGIQYTFVDTNKLHPVLEINEIDEGIANFTNYNYVYIEETHRYYWVTDIRYVRKGYVHIFLQCDVLYSWAGHIYAQEPIVLRQENVFNMYLNDGDLRAYQNPILKIQEFPNEFSRSDNCYILITNGKG